jgi:hypothetical protein
MRIGQTWDGDRQSNVRGRMAATPRLILLLTLAGSGCGASGAPPDSPATVLDFKPNQVLVTPNGTILIKGFGDHESRPMTCLAPSSNILSDGRRSDSKSMEGGVTGVTIQVERTETGELATHMGYQQTERLQALREMLVQLCFLKANGVFEDNDKEQVSFVGYTDKLLAAYLAMADKPATANPTACIDTFKCQVDTVKPATGIATELQAAAGFACKNTVRQDTGQVCPVSHGAYGTPDRPLWNGGVGDCTCVPRPVAAGEQRSTASNDGEGHGKSE